MPRKAAGRNDRRGRKGRNADVPTSAMSDIAFLLIIFFIVATSLAQFRGMKVDIPAGQKGEQSAKTTTVKLNQDKIYLGEKQVSIADLRKELKGLDLPKKDGQDKVILLEAEQNVAYQNYYEVMAAISKAGGVVAIVQDEEE